ncbi:uncharacterized protein LOC128992822 [Macrosteles quadrilineatus]|uniref:uncharacterized protein LOC128992822 n=1 Tax=Macrosteles quadrilineatus TaxID=74068 RepID=UPI0023E1A629|nr:uncharacterized protein LOC128992822 [Macrosteles quadrilineatus]
MDNASYHSKQLNKIPSSKSRKADIVRWLSDNGIEHNPVHTVAELLTTVRQHRHNFPPRYELDELALQMGHEVIRLPPYHCQYNSIELIWAQVKGEVAQNNTSFKIKDVRNLLENAMNHVTVKDWKKCVIHAENIQEEDFLKEGLRDEIMEPFITNLHDDTDSDGLSEDDGFQL